jgi:hypothetical protein
VQGFEPRLSAELFARWPNRVGEVLVHDERRSWLLLADAGVPFREFDNPPEAWLDVLPLYAELQRGEAVRAADHIAHGVPSLAPSTLPARFGSLLECALPLEPDELTQLAAFLPTFERLCGELAADGLPVTVQQDDLHMASVYKRADGLRVLDWGDSSISHPFFSTVATFRLPEEHTGVRPYDPWFVRLRDAYLEAWDTSTCSRPPVGSFAHAIAWARQRDYLPAHERPAFDVWFAHIVRRALRMQSTSTRLLP